MAVAATVARKVNSKSNLVLILRVNSNQFISMQLSKK